MKRLFFVLLALSIISCTYAIKSQCLTRNDMKLQDSTDVTCVLMYTSLGNIKIGLYKDTPLHHDNFLRLVSEKVYDGTIFHRIIKDFMVQGGDLSTNRSRLNALEYDKTIPGEFIYPKHFHKKGALAAARTGDQYNPERASSFSQFYIVVGKKFTEQQLQQMLAQRIERKKQDIFQSLLAPCRKELMKLQIAKDTAKVNEIRSQLIDATESEYKKNPILLTQDQIDAYTTIGGTPHLDGEYTVFGEVLEGMDVVEKMQSVDTDRNDCPIKDIKILKVEILK